MTSVSEQIVSYARAQLGDPYVWGAEGPDAFDCSGLVYAAYKAAGLNVTRTTAANLGRQGSAVSAAAATPGDIVYYDKPGSTDHVGIYIGNGQMINAPTQGQPVQVANIGTPTSIRHLAENSGAPGTGSTTVDTSGWEKGKVTNDGLLDQLNPLNLFASWQNDAVSIGLKLLGGGAAAALVIVGARQAIQNNRE